MAALDRSGRIAQHTVVTALSWTPGLRISIRIVRVAGPAGGPASDAVEVMEVRPDPRAEFQLTAAGHVLLPASLRHGCALRTGDRVLLAADPDRGRLLVCPPAALDALIGEPATQPAIGGGAA
jgi:hypothetical protein